MTGHATYHEGMRRLQDIRETRPLADRLEEVTMRAAFTAEDRAFIESRSMVFVATADAHGHPECSYKGGLPGFMRVLVDRTLAFPDYDGNGMYRTMRPRGPHGRRSRHSATPCRRATATRAKWSEATSP